MPTGTRKLCQLTEDLNSRSGPNITARPYHRVSTFVPFQRDIRPARIEKRPMRRSIQTGRRLAALGTLVLGLVAITASAQDGRKLIAQPVPAYPEIARRARLSGTVKVEVLIAPDGRVKDVKVIGGHPLFVDATIEALKKWKYAPSSAEAT